MLMFVQVKYQLRSRGRSVLVLCIAALLAACMAFYVGNIGVNKAALQSLSAGDVPRRRHDRARGEFA